MREQRKERSKQRPNESVDSDGAVGVEAIAVNQIAQSLPERHHAAESNESCRKDLWYPANVRVAGPSEPEETDWQCDCSYDHRWEALLGYGLSVLHIGASEVRGGAVCNHASAHYDPNDEGGKRKLGHSEAPATFFVERHWELSMISWAHGRA